MKDFPDRFRYHLLPEVNSTNLYAMEKLYAGLAAGGDVFITDFQLSGKGQRGKSWQAKPGESILMSIVLDSGRLTTSQTFRISVTVALAVKDFLEKISKQSFNIKWPNDLFSGDRKAGGILIENIVNQNILKWTVAGIGININQKDFPPELSKAVSLSMLTGEQYDCRELAIELSQFVSNRWQQLLDGGWQQLLDGYNDALYGRGEIKKLKRGAIVIPCRIKSVDQHGHLICGENDEWHFSHGEVEWLLPA